MGFARFKTLLAVLVLFSTKACAQDEPAVVYEKNFRIEITNTLDLNRKNLPVVINLSEIRKTAPDFNTSFYRVKHISGFVFEPVDIPSQIRNIQGLVTSGEELVFVLDLAPMERKTIEVQYNPTGEGKADYMIKTQVIENIFGRGNIGWENELTAYRSYSGIIDYFSKSYPHLRLHDLVADSYHQERIWGLDPYLVGPNPGICGIMLVENGQNVQYYGNPQGAFEYVHKERGTGPVWSGAAVEVVKNSRVHIEKLYSIFQGRHENVVRTAVPKELAASGVLIAPGMQKFDTEQVLVDEKLGVIAAQGKPVEEYGNIGTAIIWNPQNSEGIFETENGRFIRLKPNASGEVNYLALGVWYRGSSDQPSSPDSFFEHTRNMAREFSNPPLIKIFK